MEKRLETPKIEAMLLDFLNTEIYDPSVGIKADTHLIRAGLDSFSLLKILVFIEKNFSLRIPEAEINEDRMKSIRNIARLVHELTENA
ncbi:MAG: acyl carrier protein [Thermodesulfobacteriota bacterium]